MKTIKLSDITLRQAAASRAFPISFKERIEIARALDRLHVDRIELPVIRDAKADVLANKTIASVVGSAALSAACGMTEESVAEAWESVKGAKKPVLHIMAPVSAIQMEYQCHKKAPAMAESIRTLVSKARYYTESVEFSALDATRAERTFLYQAIETAIAAGAGQVTLCDSAGVMTPGEWTAFLGEVFEHVPELRKVEVGRGDQRHAENVCGQRRRRSGGRGRRHQGVHRSRGLPEPGRPGCLCGRERGRTGDQHGPSHHGIDTLGQADAVAPPDRAQRRLPL